jgi:MFS family permease
MGPLVGAFLEEEMGWREMYWVLGLVAAVLSVVMMVCLRETYGPVVLERKAARRRREEGNELLRSRLDDGRTSGQIVRRGIRQLGRLLNNPTCVAYARLSGTAYGYQYMALGTMDGILRKIFGDETPVRRWLLVGFILGTIFTLLVALVADFGSHLESRRRFTSHIPLTTFTTGLGLLMLGWIPVHNYSAASTLFMCGFMVM